MNILHLIDEPWDSGITNYALVLAESLRKRGHKVSVGGWSGKPPLEQAAKMGIPTIPINFNRLNIFYLRSILKREKIEIINVHGGKSHFWCNLSFYQFRNNISLVRTRADIRTPSANFFNKYLYKRSDLIICAAGIIREGCLRSLSLPPSKFIIIYQGIDINKFKPVLDNKKLRREFVIPDDIPLIGIVGRLDPVKGHTTFLKAAQIVKQMVPRIKFIITGQEENIRWHELYQLVTALKLQNDVFYTRRRVDIVEIMNACAIGVIASNGSEAVSRVALEWMACGKPVVATKVGCLPEMIRPAETGFLVNPQDPQVMAQAMARLLADNKLLGQMGKEARVTTEKKFGIENFAANTEQAYLKVVAKYR